MIREFIALLRIRAKKAAKAIKAKFSVISFHFATIPISTVWPVVSVLIVPTNAGNALNMGKRYRLTSDHSPIFSLYTFFGDRQ